MSAPSRTLAADILEATGINAVREMSIEAGVAGVGTAGGTRLAGEAEPDGLVGQGGLPAILHHQAHHVVRAQVGLGRHRAPGGAFAALVARRGVDAGGLEDVGGEGTRRSAHVGRLPALLLRTGDATSARLCSIRDSKMTLLLSAV